jgi:hypothetical protein
VKYQVDANMTAADAEVLWKAWQDTPAAVRHEIAQTVFAFSFGQAMVSPQEQRSKDFMWRLTIALKEHGFEQ